MAHLILVGQWSQSLGRLAALYTSGYSLTLLPAERLTGLPSVGAEAAILLVALTAATPLATLAGLAQTQDLPWLAWPQQDDAGLTLAAYEAGALAVLPAAVTPAALLQAVQTALRTVRPVEPAISGPTRMVRRYERGQSVTLSREQVLEVRQGVVAQTVIHADGAQVLLGLCGPGHWLVGHPEDSCAIHLIAHTDTVIEVLPWREAVLDAGFAARLRTRLRHMEAWAAMQARPFLDQRLLGILSLLAEQFGENDPQGRMINVRITHAQLASAVGATRTTVTRLLGELRQRGVLVMLGTGESERFCLRQVEATDHGPRPML